VERRRERKKNLKSEAEQTDSGSDEDKEDDSTLIKWELEWWQKPGAVIIN